MSQFATGCVYFMLWYADESRLFPYIDSLVFVGKNLHEGNQDRDAWYFQDAESFCRLGPYPYNREGDGKNSRLYVLHQEDLDQVFSADRLIGELSDWKSRFRPQESWGSRK